ncbi:hypothetical protein EV360DRAFT_72491 [Lentinula raphanica]|nr:hypothetical protein EV360DRAFT_72491 [Lentinula raphanica]
MNEHAYASDSRSSHRSSHPPDSPPSSQTPSASSPLSRDYEACMTETNGTVHHVQQELTQNDTEDGMNPGLFPALGEGQGADADADYIYSSYSATRPGSRRDLANTCPLPVPPHLTLLLIPIPINPLVQTTSKTKTHCPVSAFKTRLEQLRQRTVERAGCPTTGETRDELGDEHQEDQNEEDQENKDRQEKAEEMRKEEVEDERNEERGGEGVWGGSVRGSTVASKSSREEKED